MEDTEAEDTEEDMAAMVDGDTEAEDTEATEVEDLATEDKRPRFSCSSFSVDNLDMNCAHRCIDEFTKKNFVKMKIDDSQNCLEQI